LGTRDDLKAWGAWHPIASVFHNATKDFAPAAHQRRSTGEEMPRASSGPPPDPFKPSYGRGTRLPLLPRAGQFARVLLDRRTWRVFGREPLSRAALGTLLDLTFGVTMTGRAEDGAEVVFKTSPSSGSCHPIEAYVLALRVGGLARGLYHYAPATGTLHLVRRGASRDQIDAYIPGQWWFHDAAALVLMTAVLPRVRWRYASPRAYRSVLLGAGHLCQTFCLVATWLKLAPFCTQALADTRIEQDLGVDGVGEVIVYAAGVGTRPPDGRWVQWPPHEPGHPGLPPRTRRRR
jgi:SagB-type dehydrogenase family enzyme